MALALTRREIVPVSEKLKDPKVARAWWRRALLYVVFAAFFWAPLFLLVRYGGFGQNTALIAASIGVIPLLLLFVPLFENLFERVSSVKVAGVEVEFGQAIARSIAPAESEMVHPKLDLGREMVYEKASLDEFVGLVGQHYPQRTKRLVLAVDLKQGSDISIPMLYFQAMHLANFFDLRAFLFLDTRHEESEAKILGTIPGWQGRYLLVGRFKSLLIAYKKSIGDVQDPSYEGLSVFLHKSWSRFSNALSNDHALQEARLSGELFRSIFGEKLERCVLSYPMREEEYPLLYQYLDKTHNHLILVSDGEVVNVRTIDRVTREMVRSLLARTSISMSRSDRKPDGI